MQVIDPTFDAYWDRRTPRDIFNPLSNVVASMRYALGRYGSLPAAYDRAGGYDSGGWLETGSTLAVNRTGVPEAILTARQWDVAESAISNRSQGGDTFYTTTAESDPDRIASALLRKRNFQKRAQVV
jgi:SLT domain-containing protein